MGTPKAPKDSQSDGEPESTCSSVEEFFERVRCQSRKLDLAVGSAVEALQQSDHRRIEQIQGSIDQTFQSLEETLKKLREAHYFNRDTDPTEYG